MLGGELGRNSDFVCTLLVHFLDLDVAVTLVNEAKVVGLDNFTHNL
jgi:hypothetical protein